MLRNSLGLVAIAALTAACGSGTPEDSPMEGMSAEEHAMHMGGGMAGETDTSGLVLRQAVHLTADQERALGVVYTTVTRESLTRTIRTVGHIDPPEPRVADVTPKVDGFIEELYVASTGEAVRQGQPLLGLYSPKLVAAQEELLTAKRVVAAIDPSATEALRQANEMLAAARRRLAYWDITAEQIEAVEQTGRVSKTLTLVSPIDGIVLHKDVVQGQRVTAGARLYRLADLREVWVEGELFEQDLQFVRIGSQAHIEVAAYPGRHIMGAVSFVHPTVDEPARTNRVRVTVANRDLRLKPGMFATVYFDATIGNAVLTVPSDAVLVTGERNLVFVRMPDGTLEPHEIVLGSRGGDRIQVLSGLVEGQTIVASANFLVDAESRLGGTGGSMPGMQHGDHGSVIEPSDSTVDHRMEHNHD